MSLISLMKDDAATRMLVAAMLKKDGDDVLPVDNGAGGLSLVRAHKPTSPHAVGDLAAHTKTGVVPVNPCRHLKAAAQNFWVAHFNRPQM